MEMLIRMSQKKYSAVGANSKVNNYKVCLFCFIILCD